MEPINLKSLQTRLTSVVTKYYHWFALGVVVLVGWFGWSLVLQQEYQAIQESGILEYESSVERLEERRNNLQQLQQLAADIQKLDTERLQQIDQVLPRSIDPVELMADIQAFADAAHAEVLSLDVVLANTTVTDESEFDIVEEDADALAAEAGDSSSVDDSGTTFTQEQIRTATVALNLQTANGTYAELKEFLTALESFTPILNLRHLSFSASTTSFALQLETYYSDSTFQAE